jgi:hypothetical protein
MYTLLELSVSVSLCCNKKLKNLKTFSLGQFRYIAIRQFNAVFYRGAVSLMSVTHTSKLRVSKVAVCCFSWGICYDFYGVKTAAGG